MADPSNPVSDHPAAAWYRRELELVESDLLAVVRLHLPRVGSQLMMHALHETTGSVGGDVIEAQPQARPDLIERAEQLVLHFSTIGTRAQ